MQQKNKITLLFKIGIDQSVDPASAQLGYLEKLNNFVFKKDGRVDIAKGVRDWDGKEGEPETKQQAIRGIYSSDDEELLVFKEERGSFVNVIREDGKLRPFKSNKSPFWQAVSRDLKREQTSIYHCAYDETTAWRVGCWLIPAETEGLFDMRYYIEDRIEKETKIGLIKNVLYCDCRIFQGDPAIFFAQISANDSTMWGLRFFGFNTAHVKDLGTLKPLAPLEGKEQAKEFRWKYNLIVLKLAGEDIVLAYFDTANRVSMQRYAWVRGSLGDTPTVPSSYTLRRTEVITPPEYVHALSVFYDQGGKLVLGVTVGEETKYTKEQIKVLFPNSATVDFGSSDRLTPLDIDDFNFVPSIDRFNKMRYKIRWFEHEDDPAISPFSCSTLDFDSRGDGAELLIGCTVKPDYSSKINSDFELMWVFKSQENFEANVKQASRSKIYPKYPSSQTTDTRSFFSGDDDVVSINTDDEIVIKGITEPVELEENETFLLKAVCTSDGVVFRDLFPFIPSDFNSLSVFQFRKRDGDNLTHKGIYIFRANIENLETSAVSKKALVYDFKEFNEEITDICFCEKNNSFYLSARSGKLYRFSERNGLFEFTEVEIQDVDKVPFSPNSGISPYSKRKKLTNIIYCRTVESNSLILLNDNRIWNVNLSSDKVTLNRSFWNDFEAFNTVFTVSIRRLPVSGKFALLYKTSTRREGDLTEEDVPKTYVQWVFDDDDEPEPPTDRTVINAQSRAILPSRGSTTRYREFSPSNIDFGTIQFRGNYGFSIRSGTNKMSIFGVSRTNGKITAIDKRFEVDLRVFLAKDYSFTTRSDWVNPDSILTRHRSAPVPGGKLFYFLNLPLFSYYIEKKGIRQNKGTILEGIGEDVGFEFSGQGAVPTNGPIFTDFCIFNYSDGGSNPNAGTAFAFLCPWARRVFIVYLNDANWYSAFSGLASGSQTIDAASTSAVREISAINIRDDFGNLLQGDYENTTFLDSIIGRVDGPPLSGPVVAEAPRTVPVAIAQMGGETQRRFNLIILGHRVKESYATEFAKNRGADPRAGTQNTQTVVHTTTVIPNSYVHNEVNKVEGGAFLRFYALDADIGAISNNESRGKDTALDVDVDVSNSFMRMQASWSSRRLYFLNKEAPMYTGDLAGGATYPDGETYIKSFNSTGTTNQDNYSPDIFKYKYEGATPESTNTLVSIPTVLGIDYDTDVPDESVGGTVGSVVNSLCIPIEHQLEDVSEAFTWFSFWETMMRLDETTLITDTRESFLQFQQFVFDFGFREDIVESLTFDPMFYDVESGVPIAITPRNKDLYYNTRIQFEEELKRHVLGKSFLQGVFTYVNVKLSEHHGPDFNTRYNGPEFLRHVEITYDGRSRHDSEYILKDAVVHDTTDISRVICSIGDDNSNGLFLVGLFKNSFDIVLKFNLGFYTANTKVVPSISAQSYTSVATPRIVQRGGVSPSSDEFYMAGSHINSGNYNRSSIKIGENYYITGGGLSLYDGVKMVDYGFPVNPKIRNLVSRVQLVEAENTDSELRFVTPFYTKGAYRYRFLVIYRWIDANGFEHTSGVDTKTIFLEYPLGAELDVIDEDGNKRDTIINEVHLEASLHKPLIGSQKESYVMEVYRSEPNSDLLRLERSVSTEDAATFKVNESDKDFIEKNSRLFDPSYDLRSENFSPVSIDGIKEFKDNALIWGGTNDKRLVISSRRFSATSAKPLEFSLSYSRSFPDEVVSINRLDDVAIVFTKTRVFAINTLSFITGTGAQLEIQMPIGVGPSNSGSVLEFEGGIIWKGPKGFYRIARGRTVSYIGKGVEDFNDDNCIKSVYSAKERSMYFLLESGKTLVLNLDFMRWSQLTVPDASPTDLGLLNGERMMLIQGTLVEASRRPSTRRHVANLETSWISLDGLEGYMRLRRLVILTKSDASFGLRCRVRYNYDDDNEGNTRTLPVTEGFGEHRIIVDVQKCSSFKLLFECEANCNFSVNGVNIIYASIGTNEAKVRASGES